MRTSLSLFLLFVCTLLISCGPKPIPNDKLAFVGQWETSSGFTLEISANGTATLIQYVDQLNPDYERLCIKVGPKTIEGLSVTFTGSERIDVVKPGLYGRTYQIDKAPYQDGDSLKMVLNGVTLIKR